MAIRRGHTDKPTSITVVFKRERILRIVLFYSTTYQAVFCVSSLRTLPITLVVFFIIREPRAECSLRNRISGGVRCLHCYTRRTLMAATSTSASTDANEAEFEKIADACDTSVALPEEDLKRWFGITKEEAEGKSAAPLDRTKTVYFTSRGSPWLDSVDEKVYAVPWDTYYEFGNTVSDSEGIARRRADLVTMLALEQPFLSYGIEFYAIQYECKLSYNVMKAAKITAAKGRDQYLKIWKQNAKPWFTRSHAGRTKVAPVIFGTCTFTWINDKNELVTVSSKDLAGTWWWAPEITRLRFIYGVSGSSSSYAPTVEYYTDWLVIPMALTDFSGAPEEFILLTLLNKHAPQGITYTTPRDILNRVSTSAANGMGNNAALMSQLLQSMLSGVGQAPLRVGRPIGRTNTTVIESPLPLLHKMQARGARMYLAYRAQMSSDVKMNQTGPFPWPIEAISNPRLKI